MANLNKVMLIGRLTRDPETILEGKGAKFGFAVNNRKQTQSGQWEDVPVFIDCEIWNRGENGQQASRVLQTLRKGQQVFLEGHLALDSWTDKADGKQRSKLKVVIENFQYLEPRSEGAGGTGGGAPVSSARPAQRSMGNGGGRPLAPAAQSRNYDEPDSMPHGGQDDNDIPF